MLRLLTSPPCALPAGFRGRVITSRKGLWKGGPFKPLTEGLSRSGGRNAHGLITSRHRGGGHRKVYRDIDFARPSGTLPGVVQRLEYDPNRSAHIALVKHKGADPAAALSQQYSYVLAAQDVKEGDVLHSGDDAPIRPGNTLPLSAIPVRPWARGASRGRGRRQGVRELPARPPDIP